MSGGDGIALTSTAHPIDPNSLEEIEIEVSARNLHAIMRAVRLTEVIGYLSEEDFITVMADLIAAYRKTS